MVVAGDGREIDQRHAQHHKKDSEQQKPAGQAVSRQPPAMPVSPVDFLQHDLKKTPDCGEKHADSYIRELESTGSLNGAWALAFEAFFPEAAMMNLRWRLAFRNHRYCR